MSLTVFICALLLSSHGRVHASSCAAGGCASENKKGNAMLQTKKTSKIDEDESSEALASQLVENCPEHEGCNANDDSNCTALGIECSTRLNCCVPPPPSEQAPPALLEASSNSSTAQEFCPPFTGNSWGTYCEIVKDGEVLMDNLCCKGYCFTYPLGYWMFGGWRKC